MPARNKNRLAPLTIKPPKLRKNAAQSREKRRFCRQKPAAAAQYPNTQPTRDHANTPRQRHNDSLQAVFYHPARQKHSHYLSKNAENASKSTEIYSAARRNVAIQLAPLPTKIRQFEPILCLLQGKCGHPRQKAAIQKLRRAMAKQPHSARHSSQFLAPASCTRSLLPALCKKTACFTP